MIQPVLTGYFTRCTLILLLFVGLLSSQVQAVPLTLTQCGPEKLAVQDYLQVYQDGHADKNLTDIQQLPEQAWQSADRASLAPGFTYSAYWYRMSIDNQMSADCRLWLDLNTLRVTNVQMYSQQGIGPWQTQRAGVAYPVAQWASGQRIPSLPLVLPRTETTHVLLRLHSSHAFAIAPQLLSQFDLIKERTSESLTDGMVFGVVGLLIIFSLWVGVLFRLKILIMLALAVLSYIIYLLLVAGYAFVYLWPDAVVWNGQAIMSMEIVMRIMALSYLRVLLQVKDQPRLIRGLMSSAQVGLLALLLLRVIFPEAQWLDQGSVVSSVLRVWIVLTVLAALYSGVRLKLAYSWLIYLVVLWLIGHSSMLLFFSSGASMTVPLQNVWLIGVALPVALLLSYTLLSQITLGRQREEMALTDIAQLKSAEQETLEKRVELRTQQLRDALRNQNMLLARISHDLRAPLQHVLRDARLLQEPTTQTVHYGQSIQRAAHQQLDLIDELLEFSRGELKQLELLVAPGYFFGFLREIEETGVFLAERNHNSFKSNLANDLPLLVNADFRRLRQVIVNLLANATKFTKQGLIEFSVSLVRLDKQTGYADVSFSVSDNGIGIPKEEREHLLQPFQRGQSSGSYEGVGLGLYIVRQLLDSMRSQLEIETSKSGGVCSSFTLHLELAAEQELDQVFIESYSASSEGQERCVLIVDDVAITQEMLYELLSGYDYNPITCSSAAEALVILRDNPVDIIITDQVMPGMDGWDLLRRVRQEWPNLPIMLYSARPPVRPLDLDATIEFDACLLKPAATSDLLAQLSRMLQTK